jgi:hypothetical protein
MKFLSLSPSLAPLSLCGRVGRNNCERRLLRRVRGCASAQRSRFMNEERRLRDWSIAKLEWSCGRAQLHNSRAAGCLRRQRARLSIHCSKFGDAHTYTAHTIADHYRTQTPNCTVHTSSTIHIHIHKQTEWKVKYTAVLEVNTHGNQFKLDFVLLK